MTGYTVHTGTSKKFINGWDRVFGESDGGTQKPKSVGKSQKKKTAAKKK